MHHEDDFESKFINTIKANAKIIQLVSYETLRVHALINMAADHLGAKWFAWNRIEGLKRWNPDKLVFEQDFEVETVDPFGDSQWRQANELQSGEEVLRYFQEAGSDMILVMEDFHVDLRIEDTNKAHTHIRQLRNIALASHENKTLILAQPYQFMPPELEKDMQMLVMPLPTKEDIGDIYDKVCYTYGFDGEANKSDSLLNAALGLTIMEAEVAFSRAYVTNDKLTDDEIPIIIGEKENIIKKSGFLEYYSPSANFSDIGGLTNLLDWLKRRQKAFNEGAAEFGLDTPRGILLLGIPGTGKSLCAKAVAAQWKFPLLKMDMGKIFAGIVGESERNIRGALSVAEALAPSVLWVDEIEKGLGTRGGEMDGGTSSRVLGTFLTWMQERKKPVFVVATANNIAGLPPELLRKGRVDEIFFVDLPNLDERLEIVNIHLRKKNRNPEDYDCYKLAEMSKGYSGAELEEAVKEALFTAFDQDREVTNEDIQDAIRRTFPISRTMAEKIVTMRRWADGRAVKASAGKPDNVEVEGGEKRGNKSKQGYMNPFMRGGNK